MADYTEEQKVRRRGTWSAYMFLAGIILAANQIVFGNIRVLAAGVVLLALSVPEINDRTWRWHDFKDAGPLAERKEG